VATLLLDGDAFVDQFTENKVADPQRMQLSTRVAVQEDPAITAGGPGSRYMVRVEVTLRDGTHLTQTVEAPRGSETYFASDEDVIEKFRKLTLHQLAAADVDRIVEQVMGLEKLPDAGTLVAALSGANA
jgi:aconitate decarboxylase